MVGGSVGLSGNHTFGTVFYRRAVGRLMLFSHSGVFVPSFSHLGRFLSISFMPHRRQQGVWSLFLSDTMPGEMESEQIMTRRNVTILFMDIAGFSTMCEKVPPDALNKLTMEYLQSMCEVIVTSGGVLDKVYPPLDGAKKSIQRSLHACYSYGWQA